MEANDQVEANNQAEANREAAGRPRRIEALKIAGGPVEAGRDAR